MPPVAKQVEVARGAERIVFFGLNIFGVHEAKPVKLIWVVVHIGIAVEDQTRRADLGSGRENRAV